MRGTEEGGFAPFMDARLTELAHVFGVLFSSPPPHQVVGPRDDNGVQEFHGA